jgi:hypothetical protein
MKTLDKTKPFIQVCPPTDGAHFRQDHVDFGGQGRPLAKAEAVAVEAPKPEKTAEPEIAPGAPANWRKINFFSLQALVLKLTGEKPAKKAEAVVMMEAWLEDGGYAE